MYSSVNTNFLQYRFIYILSLCYTDVHFITSLPVLYTIFRQQLWLCLRNFLSLPCQGAKYVSKVIFRCIFFELRPPIFHPQYPSQPFRSRQNNPQASLFLRLPNDWSGADTQALVNERRNPLFLTEFTPLAKPH